MSATKKNRNENEPQKRIEYSQRKTQTRESSLFRKNHWTNKIKTAYEGLKYLEDSGREFKGQDPLLKNVEGQTFNDPNEVHNNRRTLETNYIYIISKIINKKYFFKVGIGGTGNATDGPGRLGDAQTFLIPGLKESVGFRVHYLLFYNKNIPHPNNGQYMNHYVEQQIHRNLRNEFAAASIQFPTTRPSEWYLVKQNEVTFFLGFIFDIVASQQLAPLHVWKLKKPVEGSNGKEEVKIRDEVKEKDWKERMQHNPKYKALFDGEISTRDKGPAPVGTQIIRIEMLTDKGTVELFKEALLPDQYPEKIEFQDANHQLFSFSLENIIKNMRARDDKQPLERYEIYGVIAIENDTTITALKANGFRLFEHVQTRHQPKKMYSIHIGDLLEIIRQEKYNTDTKYGEWGLREKYEYYRSDKVREDTVVEIPSEHHVVAPAWYYDVDVQNHFANLMANDDDYKFHEDFVDNTYNERGNWEVIAYQQNQDGYFDVQRVRLSNKVRVPNTEEFVSVVRVMKLLELAHEPQIEKQTKTAQKKIERSTKSVKLADKNTEIKKGMIIEIQDNYFTFYDERGNAEDPAKHTGKQFYVVSKVYEKNGTLNPWFDVKVHPHIDNLRWVIWAGDPKLPSKLKIIAKTPKQAIVLREKLDREKYPHLADADVNHKKKWQTGDVIRMIPNSEKNMAFGEEFTSKDEYHYANIVKASQGVYTITYLPPWDKKGKWAANAGIKGNARRKVYHHAFKMPDLEMYAQKVTGHKERMKEMTEYQKKLKGDLKVRRSVRIRRKSKDNTKQKGGHNKTRKRVAS